MSSTSVMELEVSELSKYGFKSGNEYVNWGKQCTDTDKGLVVPGGAYSFNIFIADSGKKYVNTVKVLESPKAKPAPLPTPIKAATPKPEAKPMVKVKIDEAMTRADWDAKDVRISRQGVIQAAVQAVAPLVALEDLFKTAETLANQMLEFVNQK